MVSILVDPSFENSIWCHSLMNSLLDQLRLKRIPYCMIKDNYSVVSQSVFIVSSNYSWTKAAIQRFNAVNIIPILICNQFDRIPECVYSCVCSDVNDSMKGLLEQIKIAGKRRIALYGFNLQSISDTGRIESLQIWKDHYIESMQLYENKGSLKNCFDEFYPSYDQFDAVICANDFAAISLVRNSLLFEKDVLSNLYIISCAQSAISKYYERFIHSLDMNYEDYGKAAVFIYDSLRKNNYVSVMNIGVKWTFDRKNQGNVAQDMHFNLPESGDKIYSDKELQQMMQIENLLDFMDETDWLILCSLASGHSYESVALECYLADSTLKYRIKKMIQTGQVNNKNELVELFCKYVLLSENNPY